MKSNDKNLHPEIKGWGIDADPKNDPTYPFKKRLSEEEKQNLMDRPTQQISNVEILKSIERPNLSSVFGTASPPKGLSGAIRRMAFKHSEGEYRHWLPLMLADRIDSWEGILGDLARGHIPNIFAEKGFKAEWKHNRKAVIQKGVTTAVALSAGLIAFYYFRNKNKKA